MTTFNWQTPQLVEPGDRGADCAQCDQPKEEDNTDPMCLTCTERYWLDTHGYPFPKRGNQ